MKKILSVWLVIAMLLSSMLGCGALAVAETDEELARAVEYGFVPESLLINPDIPISWIEFCEMAGKMIEARDPDALYKWKDMTANAPRTKMKRDGGMMGLFFAAETLGMQDSNADRPEEFNSYAPLVLKRATMNYPVFDFPVYVGPACEFCARRVSLVSGKPLLEFDESGDLRIEQDFTIREAAHAILRLHESAEVPLPIQPMQASELDDELLRAYNVGLLPEEWLENMNLFVTIGEFNRELSKVVEMYNPDLLPEWNEVAEVAMGWEETAFRDAAIMSIFHAAVVMDITDQYGDSFSINADWMSKSSLHPTDWFGHRFEEQYDYFPGWEDISEEPSDDYLNFLLDRVSLVSGNSFFDPTEDWAVGYDLNVTREEAARALIRFVECDPRIAPADEADGPDLPEDEFTRAAEYGFVTEEMAADPDTAITWKQFCEAAGRMIEARDPSALAEWQELTAEAPDTPMTREGGMISLLFAGKALNIAEFNADHPEYFFDNLDILREAATREYPIFPYDTLMFFDMDCRDDDHVEPAYNYCLRRVSLVSGKPLMEIDENRDFRLLEDFTVREAALAILRLYESGGTYKADPAVVEALDDELRRAYDAGLLPDQWLDDLSQVPTVCEFTQPLARIIETYNPDRLLEWYDIAEYAMLWEKKNIVRHDVIMCLYQAAVFMGIQDKQGNAAAEKWQNMSSLSHEEWWDFESRYHIDYFQNWDSLDGDYMADAPAFIQTRVSLVSDKSVITPTEDWSLGFSLPVNREEAARILVRFMECDPLITYGERRYVSLEEAGSYDKTIITDELLNAESDLPEVTQAKLPSDWKGTGESSYKSALNQHMHFYRHFEEANIRFRAENGFNFTRLFFGFESLRYPDFPEDARLVCEEELRELDQLLAWCMEYGVHLQLTGQNYLNDNGLPLYPDDHGPGEGNGCMPLTDEQWQLFTDYWTMLAERYKDIPSKYLSFDLCSEIEPQTKEQLDYAKKGLAGLVSAIREISPERVLLYSLSNYSANGDIRFEWTESIASLGVAIGYHPYSPGFLLTAGWDYDRTYNPYAEPCWPQPIFPTINVSSRLAPIILTGEIGGATLGIHAEASGQSPTVVVTADGKRISTLEFRGTPGDDGQYYYYDKLYSVQVPEGAQRVEIMVEDDWVIIDTLVLEKDGVKTVMVSSDVLDVRLEIDPLPLVIHGDGTYSNSEGSVFDEDYIYENRIKPYIEIAERYNVGFMCNEFGSFASWGSWSESGEFFPVELIAASTETYLSMFEKYGIGWCYCEMAQLITGVFGNPAQWAGTTMEEYSYTFDDGSTDTISASVEMMDVLRKYTMADGERPLPSSASPESQYEELKKGDKGDAVKALQEALISAGYLSDKADGIFGKNTQAAVKAFQKANSLEATGIADNVMQQILFHS